MASKNIIAFQGVKGAHSDLACRKAYPYMETISFSTFDDAVKSVENEQADLCMIPIENSRAGRVAEIHNLLPHTSLYIVGEYFQKIEHFLVAPKGTKIEDVKEIYSHPQALMQCKGAIREINNNRDHGDYIKTQDFANTAMAAEYVAKEGDKTKAAIASSLAAELYGLEILQKNFEDDKNNTTVFVAMAREPLDVSAKSKMVITSLLFNARNIPASLYKSLGGFATNHVNLLKVESYIPSGESKTAQFFISFVGHPEQKNVRLAIEELGFFSNKVKMLGIYEASPDRKM